MVTLFAAVPTFVPLEVPDIPVPLVYREGQYERWWYEDTRSKWVVIEDCWSNPQVVLGWNSLESAVRQVLLSTPTVGMVSSDLDWAADGFCLRYQGLESDVLSQREAYFQILQVESIESVVNNDHTLDQVHYAWMADEPFVRTTFQKRRMWKQFWTDTEQRTIYTSAEPLTLSPLYNEREVLLSLKERERPRKPNQICNVHVRPEFPQVAVTIEAKYVDLSTSEMRILSAILGDGVRSRLSQRVREELGLVYSIGTQFTGEAIGIHYSVAPEHLYESLVAVADVLKIVSQAGPSLAEVSSARSMFLLRQYELLEDPASFVRMAGRFATPDGWTNYIERTIGVFDADTLAEQPIDTPNLRVWMTGPLKHVEVLTSEDSGGSSLCSVLKDGMH